VQDGTALLNTPIVAAPDNRIAVYDHRADGDTAFQEPLPRFLDRCFEKSVCGIHLLLLLRTPKNVTVVGLSLQNLAKSEAHTSRGI